jgi:hypothetical protein
VTLPAEPGTGWLRSASALSATDVWAVGNYSIGSPAVRYTLAEHWDGTTWTITPSPNPGSANNEFRGVAAVSPDDIWAVGFSGVMYETDLLIERWNGTSWTVVPAPDTGLPVNELHDITVRNADDIWAVGFAGDPFTIHALLLHWDGTSWSILPNPMPGLSTTLNGVHALDWDDAWAVGAYYDQQATVWRNLALHWDGTYWTAGAMASNYFGRLQDVAMLTHDDAWAVGEGSSNSLLHWDGTQWTAVQSPPTGGFQAIVARTPSDAWAVGSAGYSNGALLLHWDGAQWTSFPNLSDAYAYGVAVVADADVWAVGARYADGADILRFSDPCATPSPTPSPTMTVAGTPPTNTAIPDPSPTRTRVASHTPTPTASASPTCRPDWYVAPGPDTGDVSQAPLSGVAVASANDIWAVGFYQEVVPPYHDRTYTIHWNGASWTHIPSPNYGTEPSYLLDVAARTSNDVWAVGYYQSSVYGAFEPLTLHWDGTSWTLVPSPIVLGANTTLESVAILSANDVWAVGNSANDTSVTFHWNGTAWQAVQNGISGSLHSVTALASNDVWAAGYSVAGCLGQTVIAHWDGQHWSVMPSPNPSPTSRLFGVYARGSNDIWAVGTQSPYCSGGSYTSLILHWDGTAWTSLPGNDPDPGFLGYIHLYSVVALASDDAWAVGYTTVGVQPVIKHWDGYTWSNVAQPNPASSLSALTAMAAVAPNDIWAVGSTRPSMPLVNRFHPCWVASPTSTPSPSTTALTPTACAITFSDVPEGSTFYPFIRCLACRSIINGYPDGTFRPNNHVTRGQLSKIISNAAGFSDWQPDQMFEDVPVGSPFQVFIGRLASRGYISGYSCGNPEPCVPPSNLPYFRPNNSATRGQIAKIDSNAAGFADPPSGQQFEDVIAGSTYYTYTYRLVMRSVMSGYPCGGAGEPCAPPGNLPYFRPGANTTRGQAAKIVANTFYPECQSP